MQRLFSLFKLKFPYRTTPRFWLILGTMLLLSTSFFLYQKHNQKETTDLSIQRNFLKKDYQYQNQNQDFQIKLLNKKITTPQVQFARGDIKLDMKLLSLNETNSQIKDHQIIQNQNQDQLNLQEVFPQTDLAYSIIDKGLKEDIILKSPEALQNITKNFYYAFEFNTQGARMGKLENIKNTQAPVFYDDQGNYAFHLLPLVMIDAKGNQSDKVKLVLEKKDDNHYLAKIYPDKQWLTSPDRAFPIKIDPSIVYDESSEFALGSLNRTIDTGSGSTPQVQIQNPFGGNDQFTKLLLHGDGADNSTTFSDSSMSSAQRKTITRNGDAKIEADQSKFGGTSMYFDGTGDYLSVADSDDWDFGSGDFTIDFWMNPTTLTHDDGIIAGGSSGSNGYAVAIHSGTKLVMYSDDGSMGVLTSEILTVNLWNHYAFVRNGNVAQWYVNGIISGSSVNITGKTFNSTSGIKIGRYLTNTDGWYFDGYLDELRISKGIARWTSNFTPPTRAYDGPKNYGVYNSPVIDSGDSGTDWQTITWTENGVQTGDGETPYSTDGLVAQWNFNETSGTTAVSGGSCGTSCNGTLTNMTTTGQDTSTNSGWTANNGRWPKTNPAGLMFDGTNDYVSVVDSDNWDFTGDTTIEFWINPSNLSNNPVIFGQSADNILTDADHYAYYDSSTNEIRWLAKATEWRTAVTLKTGEWAYISLIKNGSNLFIYKNGFLMNSVATEGIPNGISASFRLGYNFNIGYLSGVIDSFRIYKGRALSANEILSNYNTGNLEIQTRTGNSIDPNDGTWEDWKPSGSGTETAVLNLDEDSDNWEGKMDQYTKLLLHGDGTNGSTSFADKSLYTKTITPAGNAQISTAQSKFGNSAMYFDGSGDYLSVPDSEDWNFGSGDFTIDFWVYPTNLGSANQELFLQPQGNYIPVSLYINTGSKLSFTSSSNGTSEDIASSVAGTTSLANNNWHHIALVRNGTSYKAYLNGSQEISITSSLSPFNSSGTFNFSYYTAGNPMYFFGYLDELRISKGIARWTSNFTPPNQAYYNPSWLPVEENKVDNDGNTKLLLHGDGDNNSTNFVDSSFQEHSIAHAGDAKISTTQSKFGNSAMSFDGTGDYLSVSDSDDWNFGSGDFTIDGWVRFNSVSTLQYIYSQGTSSGGSFLYYDNVNNTIVFMDYNGSSYTIQFSASFIPSVNSWYHFAIVRNGSSWYLFIDGISKTLSLVSGSYSNTPGNYLAPFIVGDRSDSHYPFNGYIDELRISKGIARWTSNFTPPEAPYSDPNTQKIEGTGSMKVEQGKSQCDANTVAYWTLDETGGSNAYLKDACGGNHGTPTGTTVANGISDKARSFNGTSDYVEFSDYYNLVPATLNIWIKPFRWSEGDVLFSKNNGGPTNGYLQYYGGSLKFYAPGNVQTVNFGTPSLNNWHNLILTIDGSSHKAYLDGVLVSSVSSSVALFSGNYNFQVGRFNTGSYFFNGQIDEVRISNIARTPEEIAEDYRMGRDHRLSRSLDATDFSSKNKLPFYVASDKTGTFMETTIGESAFANYEPDASDVLFLHGDENVNSTSIKDSSNFGKIVTANGDAKIKGPGKIGNAMYFDGTGDYLSLADSEDWNFGAGSFLIDWWMMVSDGGASTDPIIGRINSASPYQGYYIDRNGSGINFATNNNIVLLGVSNVVQQNVWQHFAYVYNGSTLKLYVDGVEKGSVVGTVQNYNTNLWVARAQYTGWGETKCNLDELRISKGIARTPSEIRQAYEVGRRTHPITIDFSASLDSGNLITNSSDLSFTINSQTTGSPNKGDNLYNGDKIIIKENYDGTEYLAQGTVNSTNQSTGATTVTSWDSGSTFPSSGFTQNATVFKWQKEYWDLSGITDNQKNAINRMTLRITDGSEARNIYLDDFKSSSSYLTNPTSSTISSSNNRYFQYRTIFSNNQQMSVSPALTSTTVDYLYQYNLNYTAGENGTLSGETSQTVYQGADGTAVSANANEGYHFTSWSDSSTANPRTDTNVQADINVTASFAINTYTVTFQDHDNTVLKTETVNHGSNATPPTDPQRTGYTFTGWDSTYTNITANKTITAQYSINQYTVTFNKNTGDTEASPTSQTTNYNTTITLPTPPTKADYAFTAWNTQVNGEGTTFNESTPVTDNLTVYAQWTLSASAPTITNSTGASNIDVTQARLNCNLTDNGDTNTTVSIYWGDNNGITTPANWDSVINLGVLAEGATSQLITGLDPQKQYFYRCYATNSQGEDWADATAEFETLLGSGSPMIINKGTIFNKGLILR